MKSIQILLLSIATLTPFQINASAGQEEINRAQKEKEVITQVRVIIPDNILQAMEDNDNKTVIDWINQSPENKNAHDGSASEAPLLYYAIGTQADDTFRMLLAKDVDTLTTLPNGDTVLDSLLTDSWRPVELLGRAIPLVELMIQQGADLDQLLKRVAQREAIFSKERRFPWYQKVHKIDLKIKKIINDEKEYRAGKRPEKETEKVASEQQLILKEIMGKNFKELFDKPQGDQIIVHKMKKAIREDNLKALKKLIGKQNQYIELKDENGYTPLLQAVFTNKPNAVALLLQEGANPEAVIIAADGKPVNAQALAMILGYEEIAALLMTASKKEKASKK